MKTLLVSVIIFSAYAVASLNDENAKLKEALNGDTWCEIKYQASTAWHKCRIIGKDELNRQVSQIDY